MQAQNPELKLQYEREREKRERERETAGEHKLMYRHWENI
jgi:hypothetical protein